jgi:hypothetical protein
MADLLVRLNGCTLTVNYVDTFSSIDLFGMEKDSEDKIVLKDPK